MSRHHMTLPPITYTPLPKTKPAERRTNAGKVLKSGATFAAADVDETDDTDEIGTFGRQINPIVGRSKRDDGSEEDDTRKGKRPPTINALSDETLGALLVLQEQQTAGDVNRIEYSAVSGKGSEAISTS